MSGSPTLVFEGTTVPVRARRADIGGQEADFPGPWDRRVARLQTDVSGNWILVVEEGTRYRFVPEPDVITQGRRYRLVSGRPYRVSLGNVEFDIRWDGAAPPASQTAVISPDPAPRVQPPQRVPPVIPLTGQGTITVGRRDCILNLADDTVAPYHLDITRVDTGWRVVDRSGGIGFFATGSRQVRTRLPQTATLQVGRTELALDSSGVHVVPKLPGQPALVIRDLDVSYRGKGDRGSMRPLALSGLNLTASECSVTAVVGPSGAGKSTLCKALLGEMSVTRGEVRFRSADLSRSDNAWPMVSYVPQHVSLPEELTTKQAVTYAARLRMRNEGSSAINDMVRRALDLVDLQDHSEHKVSALSGGQKKRVSIALELVTRPLLLLLDEPTSGLDEGLDRSVMTTLRRIAESGTVVVVVTHSTANLELADQVLALRTGGVPAYSGPPGGLLAHLGANTHADAMDALRKPGTRTPVAPQQQIASAGGPTGIATRPAAAGLSAVGILLQREFVRLFGSSRRVSTVGAIFAPWIATTLLLFIATDHGLDRANGSDRIVPSVVVVLVFLSFFGMALAATRLVEDYEFTKRERRWGISARSVVASRLLALGAVATAQAVLVDAALYFAGRGPQTDSSVDIAAFLVSTVLISWASVSVGLFISTLQPRVPPTVEWALYALMAVAAVGVSLTGLLLPLGRVLQIVAYGLPVRWGASALSATLELAHGGSEPPWALFAQPDLLLDDDRLHLIVAWGALALLAVGYAIFAAVLLERRTRRVE